jgi:hypothetical protein
MPIASVTRSVKFAQKGAPGKSGRIPYPAGEYNLYTSYICTDTVTPYVLDGKYYVMNRNGTWVGQGMPSNINSPRKDVAVNGLNATWTLVEDYTAIFVEILMANFAKLASAIFSGDYMFSQQGGDADGNPTSNYEEFNTGNFVPNLLLDFATGLFKGNKVEVNGGVFKNIRSPNDSFKIDEEGNIQIIGELSTSMNGTRIEISPKTNSIKMFNQDNNEVGRISFMTEEWMGTTNYYPRVFLRRFSGNNMIDEIQTTGSSINGYSVVGSNYLEYNLGPFGLIFSENGKETKRYSNK